jgi:outer membrane receptor protein involved in Fe transport
MNIVRSIPSSPSAGALNRSLALGVLTAAGFTLVPTLGLAQAPGTTAQAADNAIRQAELLQREQAAREQQSQAVAQPAAQEGDVPETYPGENADLGPQMLLKQKGPQRKPLFEFSTDTMFTWTSNALGDPKVKGNARQDTGAVAQTFSLALAPEPIALAGGKLSLRTGYRHLFYMYDVSNKSAPLNGNNFEMSTLFVGANFNFKENWNAGLGLDYNRLLFQKRPWDLAQRPLDPSNWSEGYVEYNPNWSLSRNIGLAEKLNLSVSYTGGYHFSRTDTSPLDTNDYSKSGDKLENGVSLSLIWVPLEKLLLIPSIRFTHYAYTQGQRLEGHRQDRALSPGLTVMYSLTPRISLRFSVSSEFRHSTAPENSGIRKLDAGGGVSFSVKF